MNGGRMSSKRIVRLALFTAVALILSLIENSFPPLLSFAPGAKMGLANVAGLIALILLGTADAYIILVVRCFLASVFGGNLTALMYSVPAGIISLTVQALMYKFLFPKVSLLCVSFTGAVTHNVTQLIIASLVVGVNLMPILWFMLAASAAAGVFVGLTAWFCVKYLPKSIYTDNYAKKTPKETLNKYD